MIRMSQMIKSSKERTESKDTPVEKKPSAASAQHTPPKSADQSEFAIDVSDLARLMPDLIDGAVEPAPEPEAEQPPEISPERIRSSQVYGEVLQEIHGILDAVKRHELLATEAIVSTAKRLIEELKQDDGLLQEVVQDREEEDYLSVNLINVTIISIKIALELKYDENQLLILALASLLHDLGMTVVPLEVINKARLTPEELALIKRHPEETKRILAELGGSLASLGEIAVQKQEREDGSGYPRGLKGDEINEFAKVIGLADTYEAMTHTRSHRQALVSYRALKEVIDLRNQHFAPKIVKALIDVVSIFPLGSLVRLNNGAIGRVVKTSRAHPMRPTLEILMTARGDKPPKSTFLHLEEEPMLYVTDPAVSYSEIPED